MAFVRGEGAEVAVRSYVAIGRETTYGTMNSTSASMKALEPLSCTFRTDITTQKVDSLSTNRGPSRRVTLDKTVAGTIEQNLHPEESVLLVASALGGSITSASSSSAYQHIVESGNFDVTIPSVCFVVRKGTSAKDWNYTGGRCNSMKITGNAGELVRCSYDMIFQDSTLLTEDFSTELSISTVLPFTYVQGVFTYSAVTEYITGFELTVNNNLKSDKDARHLGSNIISTLPATRRDIEFKITQRFDTTSTYDRFIDNSFAAVRLKFSGASISTSGVYECQIDLAKVYMKSPDPELGGSGDILMSEIEYDVVVNNPHTLSGYDIRFTFLNTTATYNI